MLTHVSDLDDKELLKVSEINSLRQMIDTLGRVGKLMQAQTETLTGLSEKVSNMHTDIEVMKVRDEQFAALAAQFTLIDQRMRAMEMRNAQQDGAGKAITTLKDFGPWLVALLVALWGVFERKPG